MLFVLAAASTNASQDSNMQNARHIRSTSCRNSANISRLIFSMSNNNFLRNCATISFVVVVLGDFLFPGTEQDMVLDITEDMLEDLFNYTKLNKTE